MFKDNRYINAGENEVYRYGKKAQELAKSSLQPNEHGYYSILANCGNYWAIGTSTGKYGEFAKFGENFLSVNKGGYVYAKAGSAKEDVFKALVNDMINKMVELNNSRRIEDEEED